MGIDDIAGFDFLEKPSRMATANSLEELFLLGALTEECKLSDPIGRQMAWLPLDPIYSKALILASGCNCLEEMLITVAMLSVESIFYAPRDKLKKGILRLGTVIDQEYSVLNFVMSTIMLLARTSSIGHPVFMYIPTP